MPVVKTKTVVPQGQSGKGLNKKKSRRQRQNRNYYALQHTKTEFNKKKKLGSYIRNFPTDQQAIRVYEKKYGAGSYAGLLASTTSRGAKLAMRLVIQNRTR